MISSREARKAARNGIQAFASFNIGILVMPEATKRLMPMGGVTMPIARLQVMMMPKWTGSTPRATAIGTIIGVRIMMFGMLSMIMPQTSMMRFMTSRMMILLSEIPRTDALIVCGKRSIVRHLAKADAAAMTKRMLT